jgi:hypothetical protein
MRLNRLFFGLLAASCALSLLCERSDVITGAGGGVVGSTLNVGRGFDAIKATGAVVDSFSLPAAPDPAFSTQFTASGDVPIGVTGDYDTLVAYMQYSARSFAAQDSHLYTGEDSLSLLGAYLYFRAAGDGAPEPVAVYRSEVLERLAPVNRQDRGFALDSGFTLSGEVDSVRLPDSLTRRIFKTRVSSDTSAACSFAFSILDYYGEPRKIHTPYIVVHVEKDDEAVRDSIPAEAEATRFTAFENTSDGRAARPYSSRYTLRTAVFKIDVSKIHDKLDSLELVNAVITVKCTTAATTYRIVVDTSDINLASADSLRKWFGSAQLTYRAGPFNVHSITTPLRKAIRRYKTNRDPYIYVYLRGETEGDMVPWEKPPQIDAVFTPSRSQ